LVAISTFVAVDVLRRPSNKSAAILGALVGLMALTRSELLLAFPLAMTLVVVAWRADSRADRRAMLRATFAVVMSTLVVLSPWVAWNQARFEDPVYLSTNDGLTLAGANCDSTYYDDVGSWDIWCAYAVDVPDGVDASQESTVMRKAGLEYWSDHIERYPVVAAARMARLLNLGFFDSVTEAGEAEGRPSWVTMLGIVQFWLLVPFAVIGTRTIGDRAQRNVLLAFWPIVIITALVANAYVRFRVPAEVGLVVLAAVGAVALSERRRSVCAKV
jgi:hypothetical protein